jgi:hypothetical protein
MVGVAAAATDARATFGVLPVTACANTAVLNRAALARRGNRFFIMFNVLVKVNC